MFELERDVREAYKFEVEDNKLTIWWEENSESEIREIDPDDIETDSNWPNKVTMTTAVHGTLTAHCLHARTA